MLALFSFTLAQAGAGGGGGPYEFKPPEFLSQSSDVRSILENEAGISVYFKASREVNLNALVGLFRTTEEHNENYILGSVPVPDYDNEFFDVRAFIGADGWVLVYYLQDKPTAAIFDWPRYDPGSNIPTKLETVAAVIGQKVGGAAGNLPFYDFRYPSATHFQLVADGGSEISNDSFEYTLPQKYTYFEASYSHRARHSRYDCISSISLDAGQLNQWQGRGAHESWGLISGAALQPNIPHSVQIDANGECAHAFVGIAFIYAKEN